MNKYKKWCNEWRRYWQSVKDSQVGMGGLNLLILVILFSLISMCNGYS